MITVDKYFHGEKMPDTKGHFSATEIETTRTKGRELKPSSNKKLHIFRGRLLCFVFNRDDDDDDKLLKVP